MAMIHDDMTPAQIVAAAGVVKDKAITAIVSEPLSPNVGAFEGIVTVCALLEEMARRFHEHVKKEEEHEHP